MLCRGVSAARPVVRWALLLLTDYSVSFCSGQLQLGPQESSRTQGRSQAHQFLMSIQPSHSFQIIPQSPTRYCYYAEFTSYWYRQRLISDRSHCTSVEMSSRSQSASLEARREERCTACNPLPRDTGTYCNFV